LARVKAEMAEILMGTLPGPARSGSASEIKSMSRIKIKGRKPSSLLDSSSIL
jgi:hypothetical protein